jgi:hypothetical protein
LTEAIAFSRKEGEDISASPGIRELNGDSTPEQLNVKNRPSVHGRFAKPSHKVATPTKHLITNDPLNRHSGVAIEDANDTAGVEIEYPQVVDISTRAGWGRIAGNATGVFHSHRDAGGNPDAAAFVPIFQLTRHASIPCDIRKGTAAVGRQPVLRHRWWRSLILGGLTISNGLADHGGAILDKARASLTNAHFVVSNNRAAGSLGCVRERFPCRVRKHDR